MDHDCYSRATNRRLLKRRPDRCLSEFGGRLSGRLAPTPGVLSRDVDYRVEPVWTCAHKREQASGAPPPAALFVISTLIWGSTWLAIKFQLGIVAPEVSVAYRFALAALLLGAWCALTRRSLRFGAARACVPRVAGRAAVRPQLRRRVLGGALCDVGTGRRAVLDDRVHESDRRAARSSVRRLTLRTLVAAVLGVAGVALLFVPELTRRAAAATPRSASRWVSAQR